MDDQVPTAVADLIRRRLAAAVPESTFGIWLAPIEPVGADGATLLLAAPDGIREWVQRRYTRLIIEALEGTGYTAVEFVAGEGETCP